MSDQVAEGPVEQSIATGFKVLTIALVVLGGAWIASNWRQVPAESQAVVLQFGRIVDVRAAGLTLAWPSPIGRVVLVPGPQRLLTVRSEGVARSGGLTDAYTQANGATVAPDSADDLTGDGGVVLLAATINYQVTDPAAYYLAAAHVPAALQRLFQASAVGVLAARRLDDVMIAEPVGQGADPARAADAAMRRDALRSDLVEAVNRRVDELAARGAPLGVRVARIDLDAALPPQARIAYEGVLEAMQLAEQGIADARTEATRNLQAADRERDRLLEAARASAEERVGTARAQTAPVLAVQATETPATREAVLDRIYRDQLAAVLHRVGRVTAVDPNGAHIALPATVATP